MRKSVDNGNQTDYSNPSKLLRSDLGIKNVSAIRHFNNGGPIGFERGEYCDSCFVLLKDKPKFQYRHFDVCKSCKDNLKSELRDGYRRSTPSLNDLLGIPLKERALYFSKKQLRLADEE